MLLLLWKWTICSHNVKVFLLSGKKSLSPVLSVSEILSGCHDCKLSRSEFLIHLASQILSELAKRRELRLREKEVSCLRSSGLLAAWKNLSQRVRLGSLTYCLLPQVQETMQSFSKYSFNLSFFFFFSSFFPRRRKWRSFLCPLNSSTSVYPAVESCFVMLNDSHVILPSIFVVCRV